MVSMCVCVCVCVYMYECVYTYMYVYMGSDQISLMPWLDDGSDGHMVNT